MSELGWATYLDKKAGQSYAMNQRVSVADDGYFTPTVFDNPLEVGGSLIELWKRVAAAPLSSSFMSM